MKLATKFATRSSGLLRRSSPRPADRRADHQGKLSLPVELVGLRQPSSLLARQAVPGTRATSPASSWAGRQW
jgi:hypothetical protein